MVCDLARQVDQPLCVECAACVREEMEAQTAEIEAECEAYERALRRLEQENAQPLPEEVWTPPSVSCSALHICLERVSCSARDLDAVDGGEMQHAHRAGVVAYVTVSACVCQEFKAEMAAAAEEERAEMLRAEAAEAALAVARRELDQVWSCLYARSSPYVKPCPMLSAWQRLRQERKSRSHDCQPQDAAARPGKGARSPKRHLA